MPPHPTVFIRKKVFDQIGLYNLDYRISADYDFLIKCFRLKNLNFKYLPKILVKMSIGGVSNGSIGSLIHKSIEDFQVVKENNIGGFMAVLIKNLRKLHQFYKRK